MAGRRQRAYQRFAQDRAAEREYARRLGSVATQVNRLLARHIDGENIRDVQGLQAALAIYEGELEPWANRVSGSMLKRVQKSNAEAWVRTGRFVGRSLRDIRDSPGLGALATEMQTSQVALIQDIPRAAGLRMQRLAQDASSTGRRAKSWAADLVRTPDVTKSRAMLIARTETAKANATFTRARMDLAGVTHYIWRTAGDADVREAHAEMNGRVFAINDPPEVAGEGRHGPGEVYNCRCFADPVIPEAA